MDDTYHLTDKLTLPSLLLYGEKDEIIPKRPTFYFIQRFLKHSGDNKTVAIYPKGYHMLLRDLKAQLAWQDVVVWINQPSGKLPSGAGLLCWKDIETIPIKKSSDLAPFFRTLG